jgi:enoyl-CoA hydratase
MWVYRIGAERAKRLLLTGDVISGKQAEQIGLISAAYPADKLDQEVMEGKKLRLFLF